MTEKIYVRLDLITRTRWMALTAENRGLGTKAYKSRAALIRAIKKMRPGAEIVEGIPPGFGGWE